MFRRARIVEVRPPVADRPPKQAQARTVVDAVRAPAPRKLATAPLEAFAARHDPARGKRGRKGEG
jgi:hypothetical protein